MNHDLNTKKPFSTIVSAPAGSGKTSTLVKQLCRNQSSTAITFTNKSCADIQARAEKLFDTLSHCTKNFDILTIDAFFAKLISNDTKIMPPINGTLSENELEIILEKTVNSTFDALYTQNFLQDSKNYLLSLYESNFDKIKLFLRTLLLKRSHFLDLIENMDNISYIITKNFADYKNVAYEEFYFFLGKNKEFLSFLEKLSLQELAPQNKETLDSYYTTADKEMLFALIESLANKDSSLSKKSPKKSLQTYWADFLEKNKEFCELLSQYIHIYRLIREIKDTDVEKLSLLFKNILPVLKYSYATLIVEFVESEKQDHIENLINVKKFLKRQGLITHPLNTPFLLIDEFQDTSIDHYLILMEILKCHPQMSLYLIGDPMQSIYSFREANLGNFIKIFSGKEKKLSHTSFSSSSLTTNYRSSPNLVHHVNEIFASQKNTSMFFNSIAYQPFTAGKTEEDSTFEAIATNDTKACVLDILSSLKGTTAILTRTKSQLSKIANLLQENNITFTARITASIDTSPELRSLLILTRFLQDPTIENSFLLLGSSLLGCPISRLAELDSSITDISGIPEENFQNFYHTISPHLFRLPLSELIYISLKALNDPISPELVASFLIQLKSASEMGIVDLEKLDALLDTRTGIDISSESSLVVMTIHQAKGLEFDNVILPFIEKGTKNMKEEIILYQDLLDDNPIFLMADRSNKLFELLHQHTRYRDLSEERRIFYVALTRAKQNLYLIETLGAKNSSSSFVSFLPTSVNKREVIFDK